MIASIFLSFLFAISFRVAPANAVPAAPKGASKTAPKAAPLSGVALSADKMLRDTKRGVVQLEGNIQIVFEENHLSADRATIFVNEKRIEADGKVILQNTEVYSEADRVTYFMDTKLGTFFNAFVQSGQVVFEGTVIQKTGPKEYLAEKAQYTACDSCPPAWSFSGSKIEAEIGGYADIHYPVLRFGGYPVLILPRLVIPLKSTRQSGLLVPTIQLGSASGLSVGLPYFWAISRSSDFTVTPILSEKRGFKLAGEYRYVLSQESYGQIRGAAMNDRVFNEQARRTGGSDLNPSRGFLHYRHYYGLPDDYVQRAEIRHVSDLRYTRDFNDEFPGHGDPALENRLSLTKTSEKQLTVVEATIFQNLLQTDPFANNDDAVHKLPEIRLNYVDRPILGDWLMAGIDINYSNFTRRGLSYDDFQEDPSRPGVPNRQTSPGSGVILPGGDGNFTPGLDLIRTGQRLDIAPTVYMPIQIGRAFQVQPSATFRETYYRFNTPESVSTSQFDEDAHRRYVQMDLLMSTQFTGVFAAGEGERATKWRHVIEPDVSYSTISWLERPDHPFFGDFSAQPYSRTFERVSDLDVFGSDSDPNRLRNLIQFDYHDRIFDRRLLNFGITSHLVRKKWGQDRPVYKNLLTFRISQSFDFIEAQRPSAQPLGTLNARLNYRGDNIEALTTAAYFPYANVTNSSSRLRILDSRRNFLELSYSQIFLLNAQINSFRHADRTENWGIGAGVSSRYLTLAGSLQYSPVRGELQSWRYLATILPPGRCWGIELGQEKFISAPDVRFSFNFNFNFGGDI